MSRKFGMFLVFGLVGFVAACAQKEEEVVFVDQPIVEEPRYTKY